MARVNIRCTCLIQGPAAFQPVSDTTTTVTFCSSIFCRANLPRVTASNSSSTTTTTTMPPASSSSASITPAAAAAAAGGSSTNLPGNEPYVINASGNRKFIGGAAMARRNATTIMKRKRCGTRILLPGEKDRAIQPLPSNLPPHEKFFAALLRSRTSEFMTTTNGSLSLSSLSSLSAALSSTSTSSKEALGTICQRLRLAVAVQPIASSYAYTDYNKHFAARVALVMEEARHAIAEGLATTLREKTQQQQHQNRNHHPQQQQQQNSHSRRSNHVNNENNNNNNMDNGLRVTLKSIELRDKTDHSVLHFAKTLVGTPFHPNELAALRPGTVLACVPRTTSSSTSSTTSTSSSSSTPFPFAVDTIRFLACVLPCHRDEIVATRSFPIMCFEKINAKIDTTWELTPIASLLSELRKFEACTSPATMAVPFLPDLLGVKSATHTRFSTKDTDTNDSKNNNNKNNNNNKSNAKGKEKEKKKRRKSGKDGVIKVDNDDDDSSSSSSEDGSSSECSDSSSSSSSSCSSSDDEDVVVVVPPHVRETFELPPLNLMQEKAAAAFLKSPPHVITLVQGPPGTGKTTLLVSVICRYLMESSLSTTTKCLMVCAPTNKAVTVLCTRFLEAIKNDYKFPVNAILVGDDDKMFDDVGDNHGGSENSPLRPIFLYTWIRTVLEDYSRVRRFLMGRQNNNNNGNWPTMTRLATNAEKRLQNQVSGLSKEVKVAAKVISSHLRTNGGGGASPAEAVNAIDQLIQVVQTWKNESIWANILSTAHVVFCTLASAGASVLKRSSIVVEDLIVDEAAAATEPELYIPFQYCPNRLLAVGDPKQLPATVTSQHAVNLGLAKSLHERLMYECGKEYTMLNVQYRMKPEISEFPSEQFYGGQILNSVNVTNSRYTAPILLLQGQSYSFLQVHGRERQSKSGSFENELEAQAVVALVEQLQRASSGVPGNWQSVDRIRIITFYQAQVHLIKRLLRNRRGLGDIVVATVDSSQGCEADIVIVSFVRSNTGRPEKSSVGFLSDDRRLNVALTRAKHQLINVGNPEFLMTLNETTSISKVASNAMKRQCVLPWPPTFDRNSPATTNKRSKESSRPIKQQPKRHRKDTENNNNNKNNNNKGNYNELNTARSSSSSSSLGHRREENQHRISPTVEVVNETTKAIAIANVMASARSGNYASVKENDSSTNHNQSSVSSAFSNAVDLAKVIVESTPVPMPSDASFLAANDASRNRTRSGSVSSKGTCDASDRVDTTHRQSQKVSTETIYYIEDI